jgi:predicted kinase
VAGAGKTTYALRLCEELGAIHLSVGDWLVTLFGPDAPDPPQWPWIAKRVALCEAKITGTALDCVRRRLPAILDLSFL